MLNVLCINNFDFDFYHRNNKTHNSQKIIEKFSRNPELVADRDIARREFDIMNEEIHINYHYADGKITAGTRYFIKPPVTDQGDRLKFDSKLTSGYVVSLI